MCLFIYLYVLFVLDMHLNTLDTRVCTVGDDVAVYSRNGGLPEQQSFTVCDVDCSQTTGLIQSCNTHTHTLKYLLMDRAIVSEGSDRRVPVIGTSGSCCTVF